MSSLKQAARSLLAVCVVAIGMAAAQPSAQVQVQPTTGSSAFTSITQWPVNPDFM
jgi:hypothetical protein